MRAATPQTLGWLRAAVQRELSATAPVICPSRRHFTSSTALRSSQEDGSDTSSRPSMPQTHYHFFPKTLASGPPPHGPFDIDLRALRSEFLQLQAQAHPDRHAATNKRRAEALSARINEAYKTLQSPLLRAQYLLQQRGIDVAEDERLKVEDPDLLMEVLEAREMIEEAETEEEVEAMKADNAKKIEESVGVLDKAFRDDDVEAAKEEAVRLRYWVNIKDSLDAWEKGKPVVLEH
ncbi:uncharacterized protein K452DRAFT_282735 [Aplosporella prunicola CBS 121167]|uniref:J domain-containing protein n=1 Tax=Aplosporella prunicola CBS 121167 TaxID=1176127 RepID=A0A6A6BRZ2_9PEZI|nr:uncharacterized protein K452DRAFT_282735 [Aplosporella prunicola CBS 121167]KAF2146558.1 hypothetical protein K452DRAFT_282735 [Aplosporella prunicola CBS 121167]